MRIFEYILLLISLTLLLSGCSFDDLMSSDDSPAENREPRDRREPTDPEDPGENEPDTKPGNLFIYMPSRVGGEWIYDVKVTKTSNNSDYRVMYVGREIWTCTSIKMSDSTFTFESAFSGSKTISNSEGQQQFSESTSATVIAKIRKGALVLVEENGNSISPFLGDWLFLMQGNFKVVFDGDDLQMIEATSADLTFYFEIDTISGLLDGSLIANSDYERTEIVYSIFDYK
jgi:hypothetical protein